MTKLADILTPVPIRPLSGFLGDQVGDQVGNPNNPNVHGSPMIPGVESNADGARDFDLYLQNNFEYLKALRNIAMPSEIIEPDFSVLSAKGLNPTTEVDGDNTEFIGSWFVVGASVATYIITPTQYAANSGVRSASQYYTNMVVNSLVGSPLYLYQRQLNTIRKYQTSFLTFSLDIENNNSLPFAMRLDVFTFLDPSNYVTSSANFAIEEGREQLSATVQLPSIENEPVGAAPYTEFRLQILDLPAGGIDFNLYLLKAEFGEISTPFYF